MTDDKHIRYVFWPTTPAERAYDLYLLASEMDAEQRDPKETRRLYLEAIAVGAGLTAEEQKIALVQAEVLRIAIWRSLNPNHSATVIPFRRK